MYEVIAIHSCTHLEVINLMVWRVMDVCLHNFSSHPWFIHQ